MLFGNTCTQTVSRNSSHNVKASNSTGGGNTIRTAIIAFFIGIALAVAAGGAYFHLRAKGKKPEEKPLEVHIDSVRRGDLSVVVQAPGEVQPKTKVSISARVAARIAQLPYKEGDTVTKGNGVAPGGNGDHKPASVLVRLDARDLEASLRSSLARYEAQKAQIKVAESQIAAQRAQIVGNKASCAEAEKELQRQRELLRSRRVSQAEYDVAARKVEELHATYEAAQHSLQANQQNLVVYQHNLEAADAEIMKARDNLSYAELTSPIDGIVTRLNAKEGELVMTGTMNNAGTVIMEVADLSNMLLVARLDEADVAKIKPGQPAFVRVQAYPDRVFSGTVSTIALASSSDKDMPKHFKAEIALETNGDRLYSGLTADVDIETSRHTGALLVPSQSVLARKTDDLPASLRKHSLVDPVKSVAIVVYKVVNNKAVATPIRFGPSDTTNTLVIAGLKEGDKIITGPYKILDTLKHDQAVTEEKEKPAGDKKTEKDKKKKSGEKAASS